MLTNKAGTVSIKQGGDASHLVETDALTIVADTVLKIDVPVLGKIIQIILTNTAISGQTALKAAIYAR